MTPVSLRKTQSLVREDLRMAKLLYADDLNPSQVFNLRHLSRDLDLSLKPGDLRLLSGGWYVTHVGLIRISHS